ncbi:MAG: 2OG-Fe(II) oxygenase [Planctomycetes bacterium]|nr:2OG-Fe(II) oxygenase [Planctomycetota bacterium]
MKTMKTIPAFYFDRGELARLAERHSEAFKTAKPFQHVVLEDFLPAEVIDLLVREFPGPDDIEWQLHGPGRTAWKRDKRVDKLATDDEASFGPFTRHFMGQLNSGPFLAFLERLTGTQGIFPDVSYNNCGLHSTGRGGRLMMHTDVNRHPLGLKMHQYLNLLLYLNPDWKEEYGGHLELWDRQHQPVKRILPIANRVALFNTGTRSLHGHPHPLTCPPGRRRNSLAVYYYLRERPASEEYAGLQRSVHWVPATEEDRAFARAGRAKGLARLAPFEGQTIGIGVDLIPFELPRELIDERSRTIPLYFLKPSDFGDRQAFGAAHLRAAITRHARDEAEFFKAYQPIALLGTSSGANAMDPRLITCLLDADGEMFALAGPDTSELVWVGYLDDVLDMVRR